MLNLPVPMDPPPLCGGTPRLRIYPPRLMPPGALRKALPAPRPSLPDGTFGTTLWVREEPYLLQIWTPEAWATLPDADQPCDARRIEGGAVMRLVPRA